MVNILKEDRFYVYAGVPTQIDVLANDSIRDINDIVLTATGFSKAPNVVGNLIEVTVDEYSTELVTYTVTDTVTGEVDTASAFAVSMIGTPGLGGVNIFDYGDFTEDDGILTVDLDVILDPLDTAGLNFSELSISSFINVAFPALKGDLSSDGMLSFDLDQFAALPDGQPNDIYVRFTSSNGSESAENTLYFTVTGVDDVVQTITSVDASGKMVGTTGNDILMSRSNASDELFGDNGADVFQFQSDYFDGNADSDVILDYQVGRDEIEFQDGTAIRFMFEMDNAVMFTFDGGRDSLIVFGDDVDLGNIDINGHQYESLSSTPTASTGPGSIFLDPGLVAQTLQNQNDFFNWTMGQPNSYGFDPFPIDNPFTSNPFE